MKSFTQKLILYCTGVVFISFLVVYFLFNIMVGSYIRAEAERELAGGMMDVVGLTYTVPTMMMIETANAPLSSVRVVTHGYSPYIRMGRFQMEVRPYHEWTITSREALWITELPPDMQQDMNIMGIEGTVPRPEGDLSEWEGTAHLTFRPIRQQSLVATDVIIIGAGNELIAPRLELLPYLQRAEVEFLVDYYLSNRGRLAEDTMTMVAGAGATFYLSTTSQTIGDSNLSILMYTDISAAMAFTNSMNRILGALLVLSGLLSLVISVAISARFKRAISRLCGYAETIGRGNFNEKAGAFNDAEFNRLSKSMDNMSLMLQAYENNQKQFFQNVSHELRTPLMSILGYAEGIMKDIFTKEEAADIILAEGQKMAGLVDELLYISRIDNAGEGVAESPRLHNDELTYVPPTDSAVGLIEDPQVTHNDGLPYISRKDKTAETSGAMSNLDVKELLYECSERVKPIAQSADKHVIIESQPQKININADAEKLERAIINILSNAIRHADRELKVKYCVADNNLKITVEDDGNGINPEDRPHIFERFYKGENGNYGLGLAISKDIVKSLGGSITAENKNAPDTGAVFNIILPLPTLCDGV